MGSVIGAQLALGKGLTRNVRKSDSRWAHRWMPAVATIDRLLLQVWLTIGGYEEMASATKSKSKVKLQPLGDRVVVERDESEEKTAGGILLPDSAQDKPARGRIVSVGNGRLLDDGSRSEMQVSVGDRVLFSSYAGETFSIDDQEYLLMREEDILAVIE